jgi:hypothetical protein
MGLPATRGRTAQEIKMISLHEYAAAGRTFLFRATSSRIFAWAKSRIVPRSSGLERATLRGVRPFGQPRAHSSTNFPTSSQFAPSSSRSVDKKRLRLRRLSADKSAGVAPSNTTLAHPHLGQIGVETDFASNATAKTTKLDRARHRFALCGH